MSGASRLKGKVALVLGGSRGIGEAIVRRLAREGSAVALTELFERYQRSERALVGTLAEMLPFR